MKNSLEDRIIRERERERDFFGKRDRSGILIIESGSSPFLIVRQIHARSTGIKRIEKKKKNHLLNSLFLLEGWGRGGRENEKEECRKIPIFLIFSFVSEARHHRDENTKRTKPRFVHVSTVLARTMVP